MTKPSEGNLTIMIPPRPTNLEGVYCVYRVRLSVCTRHGFRDISQVFKIHAHVDFGHRHKPTDFQRHHIQKGSLAAILDFFGYRTLNLVWLRISSPNISSTLLVCVWVKAYWFSALSLS